MGLLDFYYRGFKKYRAETENNKSCQRDRRLYAKNGLKFDYFKVTKYLCTIEEDWIIAIEKGLEFVEKAVNEERQFIRVNGEVVPIEKAKKVSKHSVEHLAKHSNMITHLPDDPDKPIIPDSIYMVEKLSDYSVYENRFLYMLLCYIRDFIDLRLKKIQRLRMTYICDFKLEKSHDGKLRKLGFNTSIHEERYDNPYPIYDELSSSLLKRIEDCQQIVIMLLNTNLMIEVAKAPMLKPPIVKTNVLKMNNNFKNSLALYDYIVSYDKDGYISEEVVKDYVPFSNAMADEFAELGALAVYLTYKNGNELEDILQQEYQKEEERRKQEETNRLLEQIKRLKKKIAETGLGVEEYILLVEKRNRMLEDDARELIIAKNTINELNLKIDELNNQIVELERRIEELKLEIERRLQEIAYLNQKYIDDMAALRKEHAIEIANLNKAHQEELEALNTSYLEKLASLKEEYENKLIELNDDFEERLKSITEEHQEELEALNREHQTELSILEENFELKFTEAMANRDNEYKALSESLAELNKNYNDLVQRLSDERLEANNKISELKAQRDDKYKEYEDKIADLIDNYNKQIEENTEAFNATEGSLRGELKELSDNNTLLRAELNAIRAEAGSLVPCEELTAQEKFKELESEYLVFNEFFKSQWELTKKMIRKNIFWTREEKARKRRLKRVKPKTIENKAEANDNNSSDSNESK